VHPSTFPLPTHAALSFHIIIITGLPLEMGESFCAGFCSKGEEFLCRVSILNGEIYM
jgi:hypothetical protein